MRGRWCAWALAAGGWLWGLGPARAGEVLRVVAAPTGEKGMYRMDAELVADVRPAAMRHVVANLCQYRDRMPFLGYCKVYRVEGPKAWSYAVVDPPLVTPRDYVILSTILEDLKPDGTGTYKTFWTLSPGNPPPPRKGFIRLEVNEGAWTLKPLAGGKRTLMLYQVRLAPGGVVPGWAASYVAKETLPDYVRTLEAVAREADARGDVKMPVAGEPWITVPVAPLDDPLPPPTKRTPPLFPPGPP